MTVTAKRVWAVTLMLADGEKRLASHSPTEWAIFSNWKQAREFAKELKRHLSKGTKVRVTKVRATLTIEEGN